MLRGEGAAGKRWRGELSETNETNWATHTMNVSGIPLNSTKNLKNCILTIGLKFKNVNITTIIFVKKVLERKSLKITWVNLFLTTKTHKPFIWLKIKQKTQQLSFPPSVYLIKIVGGHSSLSHSIITWDWKGDPTVCNIRTWSQKRETAWGCYWNQYIDRWKGRAWLICASMEKGRGCIEQTVSNRIDLRPRWNKQIKAKTLGKRAENQTGMIMDLCLSES